MLRPPSNIDGVHRPVQNYLYEIYDSILSIDAQQAQTNARVTKLSLAASESMALATPTSLAAALGLSSSSLVILDTHSARTTTYSGAGLPVLGVLFFETDRHILYAVVSVSGTPSWIYVAGTYVAGIASRPSDLGTNDIDFLFYATDQSTAYIWTGAAWDTTTRRILIGGFYGIFTHANTADRTYTLPDETGNLVYQTAGLTDHAIVLGSGGAAKIKAGTLGTTVTVLHGNAAGDPTYAAVSLTADVTGTLPVANGGTGITYNRISDTIALTNQGAAIGSTNFANSSTAGTYRLSYYLEDTTADATAGTIQLSVAFTDLAGATTVVSTALVLTALGRTSGVFFIKLASGSIAYSTILVGIFGTSKYALDMCLERLS